MKEIVNVSISGMAFVLDRECYAMLSEFLGEVQQNSGSDVLAQTEATIAERILSVQDASRPVSMGLLRPIIEDLGGLRSGTQMTDESTPKRGVSRRLFRKKRGAILGGVCNGLAAYFGVNVALWRILFLSPLIFEVFSNIWDFSPIRIHIYSSSLFSTAILFYVLLWIVVPRAKTAKEFLEMEGEDITVDGLSRASASGVVEQSRGGGVVATILKVFGIIVGGGIMLSGVAFSLFSVVSLRRLDTHSFDFGQFLDVTGLSLWNTTLWSVALIMLPCIGVFYLIIASISSRSRVSGVVLWLIFGLWLLLLIGALVLISYYMPELAVNHW